MKIGELSEQFLLINDSCQVAEIQDDLYLDLQECNSLFVQLDKNGSDYEVVYGFEGIIPNLDKELALLVAGRGGGI